MRFEKKFQKMVDESLYKEFGNDEFLAELKKMQAENNKASKDKPKARHFNIRKLAAMISCCIIAITAIIVPCVLLIDNEPFQGYMHDNELQLRSDKETFNNVSESLLLGGNEPWYVTKFIDSLSGDLLYYKALSNFEETIDSIEIKLITNPRYDYHWKGNLNKVTHLQGFEMQYSEKSEFDESLGLNVFTCQGTIATQNQTMYIDYIGYSETEANPFLTFLETILEPKK